LEEYVLPYGRRRGGSRRTISNIKGSKLPKLTSLPHQRDLKGGLQISQRREQPQDKSLCSGHQLLLGKEGMQWRIKGRKDREKKQWPETEFQQENHAN
jgi:hypothetical protein